MLKTGLTQQVGNDAAHGGEVIHDQDGEFGEIHVRFFACRVLFYRIKSFAIIFYCFLLIFADLNQLNEL
jgi:hypothetical protein